MRSGMVSLPSGFDVLEFMEEEEDVAFIHSFR